jgi:hypothetical protein
VKRRVIFVLTVNLNFYPGRVGDWHAEFDEELNERADKWIDINLKRIDIQFPISLKKD